MATDAKVLTVESSPTEILASMTPAQHKEWRETGKTPDLAEETVSSPVKKETAVKADDAATPAAAKTEPAEKVADSATAKTEPSKSRGKNAETRIPELLAENKRLSLELESLRKEKVPAPAKKEELAKPRRTDVDEKTGLAKYATDDEFLDARDSYVSKLASQQTRQDIAREEGERRVAEQNRLVQQKWQNALKIANERHVDFAKVCEIDAKGAFQNAELKQIRSNSVLDAFVLDSELGGSILYYLASTPGEVTRIEAMNAFAAARELTKLEDRLSGTASQPVKEDSTKPRTVSGAPAPASSTGGRATAPVDEEEAALKREDFKSYRKAANEAEWRAKKKAS